MKTPISLVAHHEAEAEKYLALASDSVGYTPVGRGAWATIAMAHLDMARWIRERTEKEYEANKHRLGPN